MFYQKINITSNYNFIEFMNYRPGNFGNSYYENAPRLGHSGLSKSNFGTYRNQNVADDPNYGEIQYMLENQRKKFRDAKDKFQNDLDSQRKLRIQFENKLIKLKDQFSKKQITISQLEFKINNLLHQNQDLLVENDRLKMELLRLEELYGAKIHDLEHQLAMQTKNFQDTTMQYNNEFQKFKKEGQDYVEQLTFDFERKIKNLEQRAKNAQNAKKDLALQNKKLSDTLISNKLNFQQELRDLHNRAREQELRKTQYLTKAFEQKMKVLEQAKDVAMRKNQDLMRALQDKDKQIDDIQNNASDNLAKYRNENADLQQQINHMTHIMNKLKNQLAQKDNLYGKSLYDNDSQANSLRNQMQLKKQQVANLTNQIKELRQALKDAQREFDQKRRQLSEQNNHNKNEARKYKQEYQRICDILKSKINQTINSTVANRR